ncbi:hypothetical protein Tco_1452375 [Tanacetum coccineum]
MSGPGELNPTPPTSAVRNTVRKGNKQISKNLNGPASDAALREYCEKYYHKLLPIIAEKVHQEKLQQEKLKEVKARLNFEEYTRNPRVQEVSQHSESRTPNVRGERRRERRPERSRSVSGSPERTSIFSRIRRDRSESPKHMLEGKGRRNGGVFNRLGDKGKSVSAHSESFLQQKKCIKDPVEIHHIKQREGESTEDFVQRFKAESRHSVDEMMRTTTTFLKGEVAASNQARKKAFLAWKQQEPRRKQNFDKKGDFRNQHRSERRRDKFTLLIKSPREIMALDKGKFTAPPPMTTPVEKRNSNKFCEFHGEVRHSTDECMQLKRQIEEMIKAGKLSHLIKEIKREGGKDQPKAAKKGETSGNDKALAILMVQPWQRVPRQRITQSFSPDPEISFPLLGDEDGMKGPMIIKADRRTLYTLDVCGWRVILINTI